MADISTELARILSAIYGEDVRGSIHDAIEKINDVSEKVIDAGTAVTSASSSSTGYYTDSLYVNTDTNDLWKCTGTDAWALIGNLKGAQGETGNGIESIELTSTSGLVDIYTITYTDGSTSTFTIHNGAVPTITINATADALSSDTPTVTVTRTGTTDAPIFSMAFSGLKGQQGVQGIQGETGETGNGIASIAKTSTSGKVDTYTITMTDGSTATFTVTNGEDGHGAGDMLQSAYDPHLDVYNAGGIVDYVSAHAALYSAGANINISSGHVISVTGLATVATSGSYNDLDDKLTQGTGIAINNNVIAVDADNAPIENSEKPVKSKGVYSALESNSAKSTSLLKSTVGWTGKNLLKPKKASGTAATGISYAVDENGCKLNGTASSPFYIEYGTITLPQGSYVYTDEVATSNNTYFMNVIPDPSTGSGNLNINNKPFTFSLSTETTLTFMVYVRSGQTVNNLLFKPMLRKADISDSTYEPYHESVEEEIEQIYADNGVLGAKNLLPLTLSGIKNLNSTRTWNGNSCEHNGITFTVDTDDKGNVTSISESGTSTGFAFLRLATVSSLNGAYILNKGISANKYVYIQNENTSVLIAKSTGNDVNVNLTPTNDVVNCIVAVNEGQTGNGIFYPMLRLASDPDDTYVPYAMTNKEITEELTAINNGLDDWTSPATVSSSGTVSFSGLNDSYGYKIYYTLPSGDSAYTFSKVTKSGSGTSVTLTYTTDAPSGTVCKLRILK